MHLMIAVCKISEANETKSPKNTHFLSHGGVWGWGGGGCGVGVGGGGVRGGGGWGGGLVGGDFYVDYRMFA